MYESDKRAEISLLWIVVMFNMAFADIIGFINPGALDEIRIMRPQQGLILFYSLLIELPIMMIFLSRILQPRINRLANLTICCITIIFIIVGGSPTLSYMFFAGIEIVCMFMIVRYVTVAGVEEKENNDKQIKMDSDENKNDY